VRSRRKPVSLRPRIRVVRDDGEIVLGPGKADLLEAIAGTGSIRKAAADLRMSYMRAWNLIRTMNGAFESPLVEKSRGGSSSGGATLTPLGAEVLRLYREMENAALEAAEPFWRALKKTLPGR
jgi:molybdate transport system regulatory protein